MYRVIYYDNPYKENGVVIHEPESYGSKLSNGVINLLLDSVSSAEFTVPFNNEGYGKFFIMKNFIEVVNKESKEQLFYGRIAKIRSNVTNSGQVNNVITCENELAYLLDSVQVFKQAKSNTMIQFVQGLLDEHNKQVEDYKKIYLGTITVTNETDNVYRGVSTGTTMDNLKDKLLNRLGGFLTITKRRGRLYLNYLKDVGTRKETPIVLGKNVIDAQRELTPENLFTRIFPFGKEIEPPDGKPNEFGNPRVDISSVNGGKNYLDNNELVSLFGVIGKSVIFDEVTQPKLLKTKGQNELNKQIFQTVSWTLNVIDLSLIDIAFNRINLGDKYSISVPLISTEETLQVISKTINITTSHKSNLTFGKQRIRLSDVKNNESRTQAIITQLKHDLDKKYSDTQMKIDDKTKTLPEIVSTVATIQEKTISLDNDMVSVSKKADDTVQLVNETKLIVEATKENVEILKDDFQDELIKQKKSMKNCKNRLMN